MQTLSKSELIILQPHSGQVVSNLLEIFLLKFEL